MKMSSFQKLIVTLFAVLYLAGCASVGAPDDTEGADGQAIEDDVANASGQVGDANVRSGLSEAERLAKEKEQKLRDELALRSVRTFYFDFDQSLIKPDATRALQAHAAYLAANPNFKVELSGHADERGTREYNLALGDRRAKAIAKFLTLNGASGSQIETISYGEEQPAVSGNTEADYAKNRRVVLEYK